MTCVNLFVNFKSEYITLLLAFLFLSGTPSSPEHLSILGQCTHLHKVEENTGSLTVRINMVCADHSMFCAVNYRQPRALNHQNSRNILNPNTQTIKTGLCHVNTFSLQ